MNKELIDYMKKIRFWLFFVLCICATSQIMNAQSKFSLNPGVYYNGSFFDDDAKGIGLILGLEYMPSKDHMFSIELRTRYGYYTFDDGTKWGEDRDGNIVPPKNPGEARLNYNLFSPQVGIVPKIHLYFDESLSFF